MTCRLRTYNHQNRTLLILAAPSLTLIHPSAALSRLRTLPFITIRYRRRRFLNLRMQTSMSMPQQLRPVFSTPAAFRMTFPIIFALCVAYAIIWCTLACGVGLNS